MAEVKGARVTPVRKETMPIKIIKLAFGPVKFINSAINAPKLAPELSDGAKTPPAPPNPNESIKPLILRNGKYHGTVLSSVNKVLTINSLPEPMVSVPKKYMVVATNNAQSTTMPICLAF